MRRLGVLGAACALTAAVGCASTTAPNPPGPPAPEQRPYAGRIVLSTPALPADSDAFNALLRPGRASRILWRGD